MKNVKSWIPAILWMGVIFFFSTDLFSAQNTTSNFAIRKLCHVLAYFILGVFYSQGQFNEKKLNRISIVMLTFLYACSDEWHQSFSSVRTASLKDVGFDTLGGILSLIQFK